MANFDKRLKFREWDSYDLSEDSKIDKYALDIEAENQPTLMAKWIELLAEAQSNLSKTKEQLANEEALLLLDAKSNGIPNISKPTDPIAKAWVRVQPSFKKAQRRKRNAENNVAYLQNARSVMEHRKACLKIESDLFITGYFSKPQVSGEVKHEQEVSRREEHSKKLKKSLKKRHLRTNEDK